MLQQCPPFDVAQTSFRVADLVEASRPGAVETALPDEGHNLVQFAGIEECAVPAADVDDGA